MHSAECSTETPEPSPAPCEHEVTDHQGDDDYSAFMSLFTTCEGSGDKGNSDGDAGDKENSDGDAGDQGEQEHDDADSDGEGACAKTSLIKFLVCSVFMVCFLFVLFLML